MYNFNYHRPTSIDEAVKQYDEAEDGQYLAGGHTLIPTMKQRLSAPTDLIDLSGIKAMQGITRSDDGAEKMLQIGALARHEEVASSPIVKSMVPVLSALAGGIGDAQVRNRGTLGGSVANCDPAADYPAAVLGLNAQLVTNRRSLDAEQFFMGMFETALDEGELLTSVHFPRPEAAAYVKFPNPASRYALVGLLVAKTNDGVRVAVTGAAPAVFRAAAMEAALTDDFSVSALDSILLPAGDMNSDMHASAEYRAHLCTVMAQRAVAAIVAQDQARARQVTSEVTSESTS